jgi:hypothetical protein
LSLLEHGFVVASKLATAANRTRSRPRASDSLSGRVGRASAFFLGPLIGIIVGFFTQSLVIALAAGTDTGAVILIAVNGWPKR